MWRGRKYGCQGLGPEPAPLQVPLGSVGVQDLIGPGQPVDGAGMARGRRRRRGGGGAVGMGGSAHGGHVEPQEPARARGPLHGDERQWG